MTLDEFRGRMHRFWESANREGLELKDSYLALERLRSLYRSLDTSERDLADQVLAEWVRSDQEAKRFDSVTLIREFAIRRAAPALREHADELRRTDDPGAPFEREKVEGLLADLTSNGATTT